MRVAASRTLVALAAILAMSLVPDEARPARGEATRSVVWARHGMVCAAQPLAVQAGVDILKQGGSAVDAAIAVNACLGVMEPTANGLGGDVFALVWDPRAKSLAGLNGSGRAPLALTIERVPPEPNGTIPVHSPYAWTVPGACDGWFELHRRFGRLPMAKVLAPAIRYAEEGFPVSPVIAADWERAVARFRDKPGFAEVFMPGGRAPREGEVFRNPALARTLRLLAARGRDAYYRGPIAEAIVAFSRRHGGFFSMEDFARHRSTWEAPISTEYRGWRVWEMPPNGQGLAALQMLNILENFDLAALGRGSADWWHVMVEAKKLAYADRARHYADPAFSPVPVERLLSKAYARERAALIDMSRAATSDAPGELPPLDRRETTYLCTADGDGMMVSLIQSNYTGFGSGHVVPDVGFGLQNRGAQFSLDPAHPNALAPGKRPFHTIIPAFVTRDGAPLMAFGLMGGDMQPQGHAQIIVNLRDHGMNLQEAGDAARFYHTGSSDPDGRVMTDGGTLNLEDGVPQAVRDELARRGHRVANALAGAFGGYQAIWRDPATGLYAGATERRKDGCAMGW
uniref:Glutathione hydrolase proenzyme n=1 Tax=Eiseniibacteriota bacterium TaxID=2212470 RepID=A0A832I9M8_UNCEI